MLEFDLGTNPSIRDSIVQRVELSSAWRGSPPRREGNSPEAVRGTTSVSAHSVCTREIDFRRRRNDVGRQGSGNPRMLSITFIRGHRRRNALRCGERAVHVDGGMEYGAGQARRGRHAGQGLGEARRCPRQGIQAPPLAFRSRSSPKDSTPSRPNAATHGPQEQGRRAQSRGG